MRDILRYWEKERINKIKAYYPHNDDVGWLLGLVDELKRKVVDRNQALTSFNNSLRERGAGMHHTDTWWD